MQELMQSYGWTWAHTNDWPTRSSVISLLPLWLTQSKTLLGQDLINFNILFLKIRRAGSKLFHSMIMGRKKELWEQRVSEEVVSSVKKENVINVSCSICMRFFKYYFKKILGTFTL